MEVCEGAPAGSVTWGGPGDRPRPVPIEGDGGMPPGRPCDEIGRGLLREKRFRVADRGPVEVGDAEGSATGGAESKGDGATELLVEDERGVSRVERRESLRRSNDPSWAAGAVEPEIVDD